jgi:hypothetical protein
MQPKQRVGDRRLRTGATHLLQRTTTRTLGSIEMGRLVLTIWLEAATAGILLVAVASLIAKRARRKLTA